MRKLVLGFFLVFFSTLLQAQTLTVQDDKFDFNVYFDKGLQVELLNNLDSDSKFGFRVKRYVNLNKVEYFIEKLVKVYKFNNITESYQNAWEYQTANSGSFFVFYDDKGLIRVEPTIIKVDGYAFYLFKINNDDDDIKNFRLIPTDKDISVLNFAFNLDDDAKLVMELTYNKTVSPQVEPAIVMGSGDVPISRPGRDAVIELRNTSYTFDKSKNLNGDSSYEKLWNLLYESQARRFGR